MAALLVGYFHYKYFPPEPTSIHVETHCLAGHIFAVSSAAIVQIQTKEGYLTCEVKTDELQ